MPKCPNCGDTLLEPFETNDQPPLTGRCPSCGFDLRAKLHPRGPFLALFSALAALLKFLSLPFSPRVSAKKLSEVPIAFEALLARGLWNTRFVKVEARTKR
jgi:hypothetical protein